MKTPAVRELRRKLAAGETTFGLWVTLESASITEMAVALGLDWVVIDAEHGHLDWGDIVHHLRAAVRSETVALVRIAELNAGLVKRALDCGADGIVIPWLETADQLRKAVAFSHYPPGGTRGVGGERATGWGGCFARSVREADENVIVAPMVESVRAGGNIAEILRVPGVDLFFIGPADYTSTAGFPGQWEGPGVAEQLLRIKDAIRAAGKYCGIVAGSNENMARRRDEGFSLVGIGLDGGLFLRTLSEALASVGIRRSVNPDLVPETAVETTTVPPSSSPAPPESPPAPPEAPPAHTEPLGAPHEEPPTEIAPDRPAVMSRPEEASVIGLAPGAAFRPLVGSHNGARDLTTGIVTLAPGIELPYHRHTFAEAVTVLRGLIEFEVEGRRYPLEILDNMMVPAGAAHRVVNASGKGAAELHIAMPTGSPARELVTWPFSPVDMPPDSRGFPGCERVSRSGAAEWYELHPGARLRDFFNRDLGCPAMSGGYGLFAPGARLPCHLHDFDESICIIDGTATCVVEGESHTLSGNATALVPRGRCHYFINETDEPMAMIWVYAGPMPERIVLAEDWCDGTCRP